VAQVYATATSYDLYAVVFHDGRASLRDCGVKTLITHIELLPLEETLRMYRHSPILTAYLLGNFVLCFYRFSQMTSKMKHRQWTLMYVVWVSKITEFTLSRSRMQRIISTNAPGTAASSQVTLLVAFIFVISFFKDIQLCDAGTRVDWRTLY
jgi:hypothetical protein